MGVISADDEIMFSHSHEFNRLPVFGFRLPVQARCFSIHYVNTLSHAFT